MIWEAATPLVPTFIFDLAKSGRRTKKFGISKLLAYGQRRPSEFNQVKNC
jgi:hypothetical protein